MGKDHYVGVFVCPVCNSDVEVDIPDIQYYTQQIERLEKERGTFKYNTDHLPHPQSIEDSGNDYYLVKVKGYAHPMMAMYLEDEDGNVGWYQNYCSKIVKEVVGWKDVS